MKQQRFAHGLAVILVGVSFVDTANWHPYLPQNLGGSGTFGWSGVMTGAATA